MRKLDVPSMKTGTTNSAPRHKYPLCAYMPIIPYNVETFRAFNNFTGVDVSPSPQSTGLERLLVVNEKTERTSSLGEISPVR